MAVYLDDTCDLLEARLEAIGRAMAVLGTDKVDVVVLNQAPIALVGCILQSWRVLCDRDPFCHHRFESLALREFAGFRMVEGRILSRRAADG